MMTPREKAIEALRPFAEAAARCVGEDENDLANWYAGVSALRRAAEALAALEQEPLPQMTSPSPALELVERLAKFLVDNTYDGATWNDLNEIERADWCDIALRAVAFILPSIQSAAKAQGLREAAAVAEGYDTGGWGEHTNMCVAQKASAEIADAILALIPEETT